jgi:hypothetical protein
MSKSHHRLLWCFIGNRGWDACKRAQQHWLVEQRLVIGFTDVSAIAIYQIKG